MCALLIAQSPGREEVAARLDAILTRRIAEGDAEGALEYSWRRLTASMRYVGRIPDAAPLRM
jgi:hypothetical protein